MSGFPIPSATGLGITIGATALVQGFTYGFGTVTQDDVVVVEGFVKNNNTVFGSFKRIRNFNIGGDITFFNSFVTNAEHYLLYAGDTVGFSFGVDTRLRGTKEINIFMDSNDTSTNPFLTDVFYFTEGRDLDLWITDLTGSITIAVPNDSSIALDNGTNGIDYTQNFVIRNSGETTLEIYGATVTGISASILDNPTGITLAAGQTTGLSVLISGSSFGTQSFALGISSNDTGDNPYNVNITQFYTPTSNMVAVLTNGSSEATISNGSTVGWFNPVVWTRRDTYQVDIYNIGTTNLILSNNSITGAYDTLTSFPSNGQIVYPSYGVLDEELKYSFTFRPKQLPTEEQEINMSFTNNGFTNGTFAFGITSLITSGLISVSVATNGVYVPITAGDVEFVATNPRGTDQLVEVIVENTGIVDLTITDLIVTLDVSEIILAPTSAVIEPNGMITLGFYIDGSSLGYATAAVGLASDYKPLQVFPFGVAHLINVEQPNMNVYYGITAIQAETTVATPNVYISDNARIDIEVRNEEPSYADLNITNVTVLGDVGSTLAIPNGGMSVAGITSLAYTIDATTVGTKVQTVNIQSDDPNDPSFTFYTTQEVLPLPVPNIKVEFISGAEYIDLTSGGSIGISGNTLNSDSIFSFRITNTNDDVSLTISGSVETGDLGATPGIDSGFLRAGESRIYSLTVDNSEYGERSASFTIESDDPDEGNFVVSLTTFVTTPPQSVSGVSLTSQDTIINAQILSPGSYITEQDYFI